MSGRLTEGGDDLGVGVEGRVDTLGRVGGSQVLDVQIDSTVIRSVVGENEHDLDAVLGRGSEDRVEMDQAVRARVVPGRGESEGACPHTQGCESKTHVVPEGVMTWK